MLSLIIPAYNEESVISDTANAAVTALSESFDDWELILVDDGSTDDTLRKLRKYEGEKVHIISYSPNRGKGYAVKRGMLAAKGELIFYTDADLAYGLNKVATAAGIFKSTDADIVAGSRKLDRDAYNKYPPVRRLMSNCFALGAKAISGMSFDTQCGFKGFKREAARSVFSRCEEERFAFDFEIMLTAKMLGLKVTEIPVRIINHRGSKVNIIRDSLRMARDVMRIKKRLKGARA
jgi:dolichyl-phosphate beta-glucosyltransferase